MHVESARGLARGKPGPGERNGDELPRAGRFSVSRLVEGTARIVSLLSALDSSVGMEARFTTCMTRSELKRCHMLKD